MSIARLGHAALRPLCDACQNELGGWSAMRVCSLLFMAVFLGLWVGFSLYDGRLIRLSWEEVTVLGAIMGAKAAQSRFEYGSRGLRQDWQHTPDDPSQGEGGHGGRE